MLQQQDKVQIEGLGITPEQVICQLESFSEGFPQIKLYAPALVDDGIHKYSTEQIDDLSLEYDKNQQLSVLKFVPASGAASRMFKFLFQFLESKKLDQNEMLIRKFFDHIADFAFYDDLSKLFLKKHNISIGEALKEGKRKLVVEELLFEDGLNYSEKPKALLKFHKYFNEIRTPFEEHILEGIAYVAKKGEANLHFTISKSDSGLFKQYVEKVNSKNADKLKLNLEFSFQERNSDTIAVDTNNQPFRTDDGNLLFRPAGHGALLQNLNCIDADIVFIKNIDNVSHEKHRGESIKYKKALGGVLIHYQSQIFDLLKKAEEGHDVFDKGKNLLKSLGWKGDFSREEIVELLNRPIRVCGMVKNEGDPGGGPYWVGDQSGVSLQIIESAQVNKKDPHQNEIFFSATHFNPVDLVCGIKDYKGKKFNLLDFRDMNTGFISEKSYEGRKLKALELPGLWNGSMANWNTIFVEVPLSTFNPVKTVLDLLKDAHLEH